MINPRSPVLTALLATTVAVSLALFWAGWRLLDQRRAVEQVESVAAEMTARLRGRLAEIGELLNGSLANPAVPPPPIEAVVVLTVSSDAVLVAGSRGLPFVPAVAASRSASDLFADGEALEFVRVDLAAAATQYERLVRHHDPRVRADALLRMGRVLRKAGDFGAALSAYERLAALGTVRVGVLPAEFAGLYGQRATLAATRDSDRERRITTQMVQGLDEGRWQVTRGVAEFYRAELGATRRPRSWALADALERMWSESNGMFTARGQRVIGGEDPRVLVVWRGGTARTALMAAFVDDVLPWPRTAEIRWQLADPKGQWIAGDRAVPSAAVTRIIGDAEYPWTLHVATAIPLAATRGNERTQIAMMATVLLCLWGATYFMARAIRREAAVGRLQSDFVAAVSHEFRSPLTTIRQMTEMLEMGRVPGEDRRQTYYRVLARESGRLQRLVETLLNFGRMEAGAVRYEFTPVDAATLVRGVVRDIEPLARESGKRIEVTGPDEDVRVRADENALAMALRNLIENAIKYSPKEPVVWVEWRKDADRAAIRVVDRGVGIPRAEHQAVFRKFVRGRSAIDTNVKGTGVGLSMVQQIVTAHDGEIQLESEVGRGSTFTVVLPIAN